MNSNVVVKELVPGLVGDYMAFFDAVYQNDPLLNFRDNPWWSGCYCLFFDDSKPEREFDAMGSNEHKRLRAERITSGQAKGFLAYLGGRVVGWCNASRRSDYVSLRHLTKAVEDPTEPIGSILCFVISSQHRRMGVATTLLESACASFRSSGLVYAEGYPRTKPANVDNPYNIPEALLNYYGPLSMYLKAGFSIHRQFDSFASVRKKL